MLKAVCLQKQWDFSGTVTGYLIADLQTGTSKIYQQSELKQCIQNGLISVINLKLSPKGTIIDRQVQTKSAESTKQSSKVFANASLQDMVISKVEKRNKQLCEKQQSEKLLLQSYFDTIHKWQSRIQKIIDSFYYIHDYDTITWSGNENIPNLYTTPDLAYNPVFYLRSDSYRHALGAYQINKDSQIYLGMCAGGACGNVSFYTNGFDIYYDESKGINAFGLKKFVKQFPAFADSFEAWFMKKYGQNIK